MGYLLGETGEAGTKEPMLGELIQSYESLAARERKQMVDYARFLKMQEGKKQQRKGQR